MQIKSLVFPDGSQHPINALDVALEVIETADEFPFLKVVPTGLKTLAFTIVDQYRSTSYEWLVRDFGVSDGIVRVTSLEDPRITLIKSWPR